MIVTALASWGVGHDRCVHNAAKAIDWLTALALLIIGALAVSLVISLSSNPTTATLLGGALLGAGAVYTLNMLLHETGSLKRRFWDKVGG
jgi:hypothetical protein